VLIAYALQRTKNIPSDNLKKYPRLSLACNKVQLVNIDGHVSPHFSGQTLPHISGHVFSRFSDQSTSATLAEGPVPILASYWRHLDAVAWAKKAGIFHDPEVVASFSHGGDEDSNQNQGPRQEAERLSA
jgi:hypothetical protein